MHLKNFLAEFTKIARNKLLGDFKICLSSLVMFRVFLKVTECSVSTLLVRCKTAVEVLEKLVSYLRSMLTHFDIL